MASAFLPQPGASALGSHTRGALRPPPLVRRRPRSPAPACAPCVSLARVSDRAGATSSGRRKARRKTGGDILRDRDSRARQTARRAPLVATWAGAVLAESAEYEFLDGRFYFPAKHVRWELLRENGNTKYQNPIGLTRLYDVEVTKGARTLRNRSAVARFDDGLKRPWEVMRGYACFWKGVKVFAKPGGFREDRSEEDVVEDGMVGTDVVEDDVVSVGAEVWEHGIVGVGSAVAEVGGSGIVRGGAEGGAEGMVGAGVEVAKDGGVRSEVWEKGMVRSKAVGEGITKVRGAGGEDGTGRKRAEVVEGGMSEVGTTDEGVGAENGEEGMVWMGGEGMEEGITRVGVEGGEVTRGVGEEVSGGMLVRRGLELLVK